MIVKIKFISVFLLFFIVSVNALSQEEVVQIATEEFNRYVPMEYKNEYVYWYTQPSASNPGSSEVYWERRINNIPVYGDRVVITVNEDSREIIHKYIRREQNIEGLDITSTLSQNQVEWFLQKSYKNIEVVEISQQINNKKIVWLATLKGTAGRAKVLVGAKNGEIEFLGGSSGEFSAQTSIKFDPTAYYIDIYSPYIIFGLLGAGGIIYFKKFHHTTRRK